jgi:hypothetical protein
MVIEHRLRLRAEQPAAVTTLFVRSGHDTRDKLRLRSADRATAAGWHPSLCSQITGRTRRVDRTLEAKARALAA